MKATFSRQTLMSGLSLIQNIVAANTTMPVLSNVLFDVNEDGVDLVTTDLECFARVRLEANIDESGKATVSAKTLADIVRALPDDNIAVVASGTRMTLTCNRNVYHLSTMSAEDFPQWPELTVKAQLTIRQADLKRLLHNTLFAIPSRDPRKVLMGALMEIDGGRLTCVATDGRKLGKSASAVTQTGGDDPITAVVPGRVLNEIDKALGEDGDAVMHFSDQRVLFSLDTLNLTYISGLIEGKFPQYQSVIPDSFKKTIALPKHVMEEAITRASILAERAHHSIILNFGEGSVGIRAQSAEDGSYEGEVDIDYDADPFKIAFNYHYLQEVFRVAPDPELQMKVKEPTAPVVFECETDADTIYLVMPIRMHDLEGRDDDAE